MSVVDLFQITFKAEHPLAKFSAVALSTAQDYGATQVPFDSNSLNGQGAFGIVQRDVRSGENAPVMLHGISRALVGAAVTRGAKLIATTSGFLITATSGAAAPGSVIGDAFTSAASGMIAHVHIRRGATGATSGGGSF